MTDLEHDLIRLIADAKTQGVSLYSITKKAGVGYHAVYRWVKGLTGSLTVGTADKLLVALTGRGIGQ